jgi:hypothetical protein
MARGSRASGIEKSRFIHDGPGYFPESVVIYTRFEHANLRQMFAYLREKESLFQQDVVRYKGTLRGQELQVRLWEVQTQLIWMTANLR